MINFTDPANLPNKTTDEVELKLFTEWLHSLLSTSVVEVTFTKKDGDIRVMKCTLDPKVLPKVELTEGKVAKKQSDNVMAVYDVGANGWRSFIIKNVTNISLDFV